MPQLRRDDGLGLRGVGVSDVGTSVSGFGLGEAKAYRFKAFRTALRQKLKVERLPTSAHA